MNNPETDLNFHSAVTNCLKNQMVRADLDSSTELGISLTLSLTGDTIICFNGEAQWEIYPSDETGKKLLLALQSQRRRFEAKKKQQPQAAKIKAKKSKNKNQQPVVVQKIPEGRKLVISEYKSLGSGKGKELKPKAKPKKIVPQTLSLSDLL